MSNRDTELSVQAILNRCFDSTTNTLFTGGAFHESFIDPDAANIAAIHAAVSGDGTLQTSAGNITQPDYPRALSVTDSSVATAGGTCTITGTDVAGSTITENFTILAGTTVSGSKPFATVTSFTIPSTVGGGVSALYVSGAGSGFPSSGELTITGGNGAAKFTFAASADGTITDIDTITASGLGYVTGNYTATTGSTGISCFVDVNDVIESTISIGTTNKLGMARKNITFTKACVDDANEAIGTEDSDDGTIIPTTPPNGSRDFEFWYKQ